MKDDINMMIRPTRDTDVADLQAVLNQLELFPSEMLPELAGGFLRGDDTPEIWLTCEISGRSVGFCYAVPEALADGTWNMLAIGILPAEQGGGCGGALAAHLEARLRSEGQRILIADTSSTAAYDRTRAFYLAKGFTEEARVRDFWGKGDDKITFWKSLV